MTYLARMKRMIANAIISTTNVPFGTRKLLARGTGPVIRLAIDDFLLFCGQALVSRAVSRDLARGLALVLGGSRGHASTKTNNAMNARLMKNTASTRPTVRKKIVCRRPCASGWRATPWM